MKELGEGDSSAQLHIGILVVSAGDNDPVLAVGHEVIDETSRLAGLDHYHTGRPVRCWKTST